jgi:hypothetical protein
MLEAPWVIVSDCGSQSVKALTGPADQCRHEAQWQYPMALGSPVTSKLTSPQKQLPFIALIYQFSRLE